MADCIKHGITLNLVIPFLAFIILILLMLKEDRCMMLCANQDLNSVVSTRKVPANKLNDPPEMQQVVGDMAGTRFSLHLSYANRRIGVPTEVGTRERKSDSRWCACAKA